MKNFITSIPFIFISILIFTAPELGVNNSLNEIKLQDKSPEIIVRDKNNKIIGEEGVSRSDASTIYIEIKSNNEEDVFVIKKGVIYIPGLNAKSFTGPRITATMMSGTVSISIDKLVRRLEDGTFEEVELETKFVSFKVK